MINQAPPLYRAPPSYLYPVVTRPTTTLAELVDQRFGPRYSLAEAYARARTPAPCFPRLERSLHGGVLDNAENRMTVQTGLMNAVSRTNTVQLQRMLNELGDSSLCMRALDGALPEESPNVQPGDTLLHFLAGGHVDSRKAAQMTTMLLQHGASPNVVNRAGKTAANRAVATRQYMQLIALVASPRTNLAARAPVALGADRRRWETIYDQAERLRDPQAMRILMSAGEDRVDTSGPVDLPSSQEWEQPAPPVVIEPVRRTMTAEAAFAPMGPQFDREGLPTYAQAKAQAEREARNKLPVAEPPPAYSKEPPRRSPPHEVR